MKCLKKLKNDGKITMKRAPQETKTPEVIKERIKVKKVPARNASHSDAGGKAAKKT